MKDSRDIWYENALYDHVRSSLRKRYPSAAGWEIHMQYNGITYIPDFVCQRRNNGIIEKVVCEVKGGSLNRISQKDILQINKYAQNLAGNNVRIIKKILAVPYGVNTSNVPPDIEIIRLKKFGYE